MEGGHKQVNNEVKAVWKCKAENCDYTRPPTLKGYKQLVGHQKEHAHLPKGERGYRLVDENTGEVLAESVREAKEKGFLVAEPPPRKESDGKPQGAEVEVTEVKASSEGIFRYTITLPADAFTLFNIAKSFGLEKDSEKPFEEWLWDCIRERFEKDYKMQLVLAPVED